MTNRMLVTFIMITVGFNKDCQGGSAIISSGQGLCGDWTSYKEEKCFKIADKAGAQTQQDAEIVCKAMGDDSSGGSSSKLVTIKTKEEQEFLQRFLFVENEITENVWLGLTKREEENGRFCWNDESELSFSNWVNQDISSKQQNCVEMEPGDGVRGEPGIWLAVNCERKNTVICERRPTWTLEMLQNTLLNFKLEEEMKRKELVQKLFESQREWEEKLIESEKELNRMKTEWAQKFVESEKEQNITQKEWESRYIQSELDITTLRQEINVLMKMTVPIGFIYVQLPDQAPPTTLWPNTNWIDISSSYAGLFFRVVGGQAAPFGQIQEANTSRLEGVIYNHPYDVNEIVVPLDGTWSKAVSASRWGTLTLDGLKFRLSTSEIRPRNKSVKVWKRIS